MADSPDPRLLVLDLDGTVLVGDGPVRAYLRELVVAGAVPAAAETELDGYLERGGGEDDAYAFVGSLAARAGVPPATRAAAYDTGRRALHAGSVPVAAAEGLAAALDRRPASVECALVTNAPTAGIEPLLERLGLSGRFDRLVGEAGKPVGMTALLTGLLVETGVPAARLLAVGDVWGNDLAAAADLGGATAQVDRFGRGDGRPTFRAPTLTALLPDIEAWWSV